VNHYLGLLIEATVAVLLIITIAYCYMLDRRLRRLRSDEILLKATIGELITATEIAERAIAGLKLLVRECDQNLGDRLRAAERFSVDIEQQIAAGASVLQRISQIAAAGRPAQPAAPPVPPVPTSNTQSTLAAAQAFVERARSRSGDLAA